MTESRLHEVVVRAISHDEDGSLYIHGVICPDAALGVNRPCVCCYENPAAYPDEPESDRPQREHRAYGKWYSDLGFDYAEADEFLTIEWLRFDAAIDAWEPFVPADECWVESVRAEFEWPEAWARGVAPTEPGRYLCAWENTGDTEESYLVLELVRRVDV